MEGSEEKAVARLRQLLNENWDDKDYKITITYKEETPRDPTSLLTLNK